MEMAIDEIKNELRSDLTIKRITGNDYSESLKDCLAQLLVIAEKYQKIEQIMESDTYKGIFTYTDDTRLNHIREVLKDGNDRR